MKRQTLIAALTTAGLALAVSIPANAASNARAWEQNKGQSAGDAAPPPPPPAQPQPQQAAPEARRGGSPRYGGVAPVPNNGRTWGTARERRDDRPVVVGPPRGHDGGRDVRILPPSRVYTPSRPPRTVTVLPPYHRQYDWRGTPYYWGGGHWYRPYRNSYIVVGAPIGMFMPYLPGSYTTVWIGGTRYYYADGSYFIYEPTRRGYVVTRSPYGDDDDEYYDDRDDDRRGDSRDEDIFIYPMRGQSEQQQSDDRYECHRWARDQTHYDPTDSEYDRDARDNYMRAMTACLTGRGYSVK